MARVTRNPYAWKQALLANIEQASSHLVVLVRQGHVSLRRDEKGETPIVATTKRPDHVAIFWKFAC